MHTSTSKKIVAIIPARGGSKRIPKKNIIPFCAKPLLAWTVEAARAVPRISPEVYVSTDDPAIAAVAAEYGAKVIERPSELAGDASSSEETLLHALGEIGSSGISYVVFLQATSPLREPHDIESALDTIVQEGADSLFSGAELKDFCIWKKRDGVFESVNYDYRNRKRSQEFETQYVENGSMYVFKPSVLELEHNRLGGKIAVSLMEFWKSFEVDDVESLQLCQEMFRIKNLSKAYGTNNK